MTQDTDALVREAREHPAVLNLIDHQRQLDPRGVRDGVEVGVSRQALDETFDLLTRLADALLRATNDLASERNVSVGLRTQVAELEGRLYRTQMGEKDV